MFEGKVLLITGGTGSFGNAMLRRVLSTDLGEIRIFSRDEKKQDDLRKSYGSDKLKCHIGDVRDQQAVINAMRGVDYVFGAAAISSSPWFRTVHFACSIPPASPASALLSSVGFGNNT